VALTVDSVSGRDIWIWDLDRETMTRLTFADKQDDVPIWTSDSQRIIFTSARESTLANSIWWKKADGTGEVEKLYSGTAAEVIAPFSSSRDGKNLVLWTLSLTPVNANIETLSMDGDQIRSPLLQKNYNELYPQVSPDGRWIAYQSNGSGRYEIFVNSFPDVNQGMWQVSKNGGDSPLWSPDGKKLFYCSNDSFIAVEVETEPVFKIGNSVVLFDGKYVRSTDANECVLWDIHPDGNRFLMVKPPATAATKPSAGESAAPAPQPKIIVVLNWFEELKERVPRD
jgi:Tol biopolymer transport system component